MKKIKLRHNTTMYFFRNVTGTYALSIETPIADYLISLEEDEVKKLLTAIREELGVSDDE